MAKPYPGDITSEGHGGGIEPVDPDWPKESFGGIDPLLVTLGRAMAPQINARLADLEKELAKRKRHPLDAPDREG